MVAQKQRQTEYNETYTQITVKHYKLKRDKKTNILLKPISNISNYMIIAVFTFT